MRWTFGSVIFCLPLWISTARSVAATPSPAPTASSSQQAIELKLVVPAAKVAWATSRLKLDEKPPAKAAVCFFDTPDGALAAKGLILRARQKAGRSGDSTVKLRTPDHAAELSDAERGIKPEEDWVNETQPVISRSLDRGSLPDGTLHQVIVGRARAKNLFNSRQRALVAARVPDFRWSHLRIYGPARAEVWQFLLTGFPKAVTVERWRLEKTGRTMEILEVSATVRANSAEEVAKMVKDFFSAAASAGLGKPEGRTKTQMVLDFLKAGD